MQTVLVTGATGFVGSHLLPSLLQREYTVRVALREQTKIKVVPEVESFLVGDISRTTDWREALDRVDVVIHLASRAHVLKEISTDPVLEFNRVNVEGTNALVQQSIDAGVRQFIFISSVGAMATFSNHRLTEASDCMPDSPYGCSKWQAEQDIVAMSKSSAMAWTILRPTLVYGPNNPGNMERLLKLVDRGLPLPFGAIKNHRSLIFVGNLVDAILTTLDNPNAHHQTFLVSDGVTLSTAELIRSIANALHCPSRLVSVPPTLLRLLGRLSGKTDSVERLLGSLTVDSGKICKTLNWVPPYSMEEGLQKTASWYCQTAAK